MTRLLGIAAIVCLTLGFFAFAQGSVWSLAYAAGAALCWLAICIISLHSNKP